MKLIILDRDGVINEDSGASIKSPDEWIPIAGSLEAIARLSHAGYLIVVATNQSGIARGLYDIETLNRIHEKMHRLTREAGGIIEAVFFCPDVDISNPDRKPNPGMFEQISRRLKISLHGIPAVGDDLRDIQAARTAGANPILVRTGKGELAMSRAIDIAEVPVFDDLAAVAAFLLV